MFLCGEVKVDALILRLSSEFEMHQRQGLVNATPSVCIHWFLVTTQPNFKQLNTIQPKQG